MHAFFVKNSTELCDVLRVWGKTAPDRLNRLGRKKEVERWVLNRFLLGTQSQTDFIFPFSVSEFEDPDFFLDSSHGRRGVEITEAVSENEQIEWTNNAKEDSTKDEGEMRFIPNQWATGTLYPEMASRAIERKSAKAGPRCSELLVYLNTHDDGWDNSAETLKKLSLRCLKLDLFQRVRVLSGQSLFELRMQIVLQVPQL